MKLNFQKFDYFVGVGHEVQQSGDARESFANLVYQNVAGVRALTLAVKIYKSEGGAEYTPDEMRIIIEVANKFCLPGFIDGLNEQIRKEGEA